MSDIPLGPEDRGRQVPVRPGDRIVLRLPENPTTGYRWSGDIPSFLRLSRDDNEPGTAPGAGGTRILGLEALAPGRAQLTLRCARSWEPDTATDEFSVFVQVG